MCRGRWSPAGTRCSTGDPQTLQNLTSYIIGRGDEGRSRGWQSLRGMTGPAAIGMRHRGSLQSPGPLARTCNKGGETTMKKAMGWAVLAAFLAAPVMTTPVMAQDEAAPAADAGAAPAEDA